MEAKNVSLEYIRELDGIRAIAVFAVMFFYLHIPGFSLGWSGVYLFFVLSGFLITSILIKNRNKSGYFFRFYTRRAIRIFPVYYFTLILVAGLGLIQKQSISDFPQYLLYLQNNILALQQWSVSFPASMNHTWSLAVESQFYLIYPPIIFYLTEKYLFVLSICIVILSFLLRVIIFFVFPENPNLLFALSPTAIDSLTIGGVLAIILNKKDALKNAIKIRFNLIILAILLFTGFLLIAIIVKTGINSYWSPYLWGKSATNLMTITVMSTFFASLIAYITLTKSWINNILNCNLLNHLGKISYGLYLYHFPVFSFFKQSQFYNNSNILSQNVIAIISTYLVALFSYLLIEKPLNFLKIRWS